MSNEKFVLMYKDGSFVQRDDSTGPMSSGGYPYPVQTINEATMWDTAHEAASYAQVSDWRDMARSVYEVVFDLGERIDFPARGQWTECNHHCVKDSLSNAQGALHYLDCSIRS